MPYLFVYFLISFYLLLYLFVHLSLYLLLYLFAYLSKLSPDKWRQRIIRATSANTQHVNSLWMRNCSDLPVVGQKTAGRQTVGLTFWLYGPSGTVDWLASAVRIVLSTHTHCADLFCYIYCFIYLCIYLLLYLLLYLCVYLFIYNYCHIYSYISLLLFIYCFIYLYICTRNCFPKKQRTYVSVRCIASSACVQGETFRPLKFIWNAHER